MTTFSAFFVIFYGSLMIGINGDTNLGASDFKCPNGASIYPHPECDKYYTCYTGQSAFLWQCSKDLLFDLVYNGCNYPDQTYCGDRTRPNGNPTTTTTPKTTTVITIQPPISCLDDGFFPVTNKKSCINGFYICLDGKAYSNGCPSYGVFDPVGRRCVSPSSSACSNSTVASTASTTTSTISSTTTSTKSTPTISASISTTLTTSPSTIGAFACPASNGNFPGPSCSQYYQCNNGIKYLFTCPNGLVFNPNLQICDWPYNVPSCTNKP